jgi:hypothetical protein
MTRSLCKFGFVAALLVAGSASRSLAQAPAASPFYPEWMTFQPVRSDSMVNAMAPPSAQGSISPAPTPNFETGWPRPPEIPASLFRQAPDPMPYGCAPIPGKYFEMDPLLDPPEYPRPGWIADLEIQAVGPHIFQSLSNGVPVGPNPPGTLRVPITPLDWTVSPRIEFGYRLASGFGEFLLSYQYLGTTGSGSTPYGPNGPAAMSGRLNINESDFDYASREFNPWEHWGMKWRFGFRQVYAFYDTQLTSSLAAATAGNGALLQSGTNGYSGWGGHVGVEINREFNRQIPGLSFVAKVDFGDTLGQLRQTVSQSLIGGAYSSGEVQNGQEVPALSGQIGLSYRPPGNRFEVYLGGYYQYWWNLGTLPNYALNAAGAPLSGGELSLTGVTLRLSFNY